MVISVAFTTVADCHYIQPLDPEIDRVWQILLDSIQLGNLADRSLVMNQPTNQIPQSRDRGF